MDVHRPISIWRLQRLAIETLRHAIGIPLPLTFWSAIRTDIDGYTQETAKTKCKSSDSERTNYSHENIKLAHMGSMGC